MGKEIIEGMSNGVMPCDSNGFEYNEKLFRKKISELEHDLLAVKDELVEQQDLFKTLEIKFNDSQATITKVETIINTLKISSPGFYSLSVANEKELQQLFYERLYLINLNQKKK